MAWSSPHATNVVAPHAIDRRFQPCRSRKGTGYMWLSPEVFTFPKQYIWPIKALTHELVDPAATTQSAGHKLRSPPWISTIFGENSSFCTLCPSRPYPPLPQVQILPSASTATQWFCPHAIFNVRTSASPATLRGIGCGSYAIFTELDAMLYSWSVPWPSWPY